MKVVSAVAVVVAVVATIVINSKGIVHVDGWSHGVALCEYGPHINEDIVTQEDEYHMWVDGGILYVINYDHIGDQELTDLENRARIVCAQYQ